MACCRCFGRSWRERKRDVATAATHRMGNAWPGNPRSGVPRVTTIASNNLIKFQITVKSSQMDRCKPTIQIISLSRASTDLVDWSWHQHYIILNWQSRLKHHDNPRLRILTWGFFLHCHNSFCETAPISDGNRPSFVFVNCFRCRRQQIAHFLFVVEKNKTLMSFYFSLSLFCFHLLGSIVNCFVFVFGRN